MAPEIVNLLTLLLLTLLSVSALFAWPRSSMVIASRPILVGGIGCFGLALAAILAEVAPSPSGWQRWAAVALSGATAVLVGGAITLAVLAAERRHSSTPVPPASGQVLRGGAWIGVLERVGIFAALITGIPEGIALILAIKGLARYPELRAGDNAGVAERFIIGTLTSMLSAAAAAGILILLLR